MRHKQVLSIALVLGLTIIAVTAHTEGNKTGLPETQITIDGGGEDWVGRSVLCVDPAGDAEAGFLDLTTGYAFVNQDALYLLIETVDPRAPFVQFSMFIEADHKSLFLQWSPGQALGDLADITTGFEYIGPLNRSSFAFGPALEVRIDLRDLGSPEHVNPNRIMVMVGECCQQPAWHEADVWRPTRPTPVVDEIDAPLSLRSERPGHVIMVDKEEKAEYLYRGFIQLPGKIAWGPDEHLYIADQLGRHVVRLSANGTMSDLGTWRNPWRNPNTWNDDSPRGIAFDSNGNLYVSDFRGDIYAVGLDGNVEALSGIRGQPLGGITFSSDDELYYTDMGGGRVLKVGADGQSQVVARGIENAFDLVFGSDGALYVSQNNLDRVARVDVTTGEVNDFFSAPISGSQIYLAIDEDGDLWIRGCNTLYQLAPDGTQKPFYVNGKSYSGDAFQLDIQTPGGITFDDEGRLWIASYNSSIRHLEPLVPGEDILGMTMTVIAPGFVPGFVAADLEVSHDGYVYVYNNSPTPGELWRISLEGDIEVLLYLRERGNVGMALDDQGKLYLGLPNGEIAWLDTTGELRHYAWLHSWSMTFAADGYLYAVVGAGGEPRSVVRIVGRDNYRTLISQIDGKPLGGNTGYGPGCVHIDPAPGEGLYIYDESHKRVYYVDFDGQASVVADLPGIGAPAAMAVSPEGDIFVIPHSSLSWGYALHRIDPDGNIEIYAMGIYGDPLGAGVSPDGRWLYISENGAIDRIPIIGSD